MFSRPVRLFPQAELKVQTFKITADKILNENFQKIYFGENGIGRNLAEDKVLPRIKI